MAPSTLSADPQALYTKATRAELAKNYDEAFRFYLKSAEGFLHQSRNSTQRTDVARWKKEASKALERAEKIKAIKNKEKGPGGGLRSVEVDIWSENEQLYVLQKSSIMNGLSIPFWSDSSPSSFSQSLNEQPPLSSAQISRNAVWGIPQLSLGQEERNKQLKPEDIVQHVVSDCSVCAAVSVCLARQNRVGPKHSTSGIPDLISLVLSTDESIEDADCRHYLKVFFNGAWRRISIDSKLPLDPSGMILGMSVCICTRALEIWPSLVEKAYMKLMGGYDFPGSNSSIDLHTLTGWIPEHIDIKSSAFSREKTWSRIISAHPNGQCILTLGTDKHADSEWAFGRWGRRFLKEHNYAVVDVKEVDTERILTLLDSRLDRHVLITEWNQPSDQPRPESLFEMYWDDVCTLFEGIYINWDPKLLRNRLEFHGKWKTHNEEDKVISSNRDLRLKVNSREEGDELWVLLTRHQISSGKKAEYIAVHVNDQHEDGIDLNRIASMGTYTNSTHVLVRTSIPQDSGAMSIVISYDGPYDEVGYTVTAYSSASISWDKYIPKTPFTQKEEGTLTTKNAGGNCTYPTYMINPQYHLRVYPDAQHAASSGRAGLKANITLICQGERDTPLNITVVWSQGERVFELAQKEVAISSGAYSYGFARASQSLPVGDYTVIVSAFESRYTGPFTLRVESSHRFELKSVPQEGAGMYRRTIRGTWVGRSAAGAPEFKRYLQNPIYEIDLPSTTQLKIRLQLTRASSTPLNVALFRSSLDLKSIGDHIITSGPYSDTISGVDTALVSLNPGKYLAIPSAYHPAAEASFILILYSSIAGVTINLRE